MTAPHLCALLPTAEMACRCCTILRRYFLNHHSFIIVLFLEFVGTNVFFYLLLSSDQVLPSDVDSFEELTNLIALCIEKVCASTAQSQSKIFPDYPFHLPHISIFVKLLFTVFPCATRECLSRAPHTEVKPRCTWRASQVHERLTVEGGLGLHFASTESNSKSAL
tara:strand:+ start:255 stop:749 length:495 start_codon:yes stop_codon:yes gene_type:complete